MWLLNWDGRCALFLRKVVFEGDVEIVNSGKEPKTVAAGVYKDTKLDLTDA